MPCIIPYPVAASTVAVYENQAPPALTIGVDSILVDVPTPQAGHYFVTGGIDISPLEQHGQNIPPVYNGPSDVLVITERYGNVAAGMDENHLVHTHSWTYYDGWQTDSPVEQDESASCFLGKMCHPNDFFQIVIRQTAGTGRVIPYSFILQVLNY
jgi:hypothetical protein